jgi:hypothetical protein
MALFFCAVDSLTWPQSAPWLPRHPMTHYQFRRLFLTLAAVALCATTSLYATKLIAVWADPAAGQTRFTKVIVAFQSADEVMRRNSEVTFVKRFPKATAAYTMMQGVDVKDRDQVKALVEKAGFDGAVIMHLVRTDKETIYSPGTTWWGTAPYTSMWGFWGYGWGTAYQPGYITNDHLVTIETNVYSVKEDKLLWASRSETTNPETVSKLIDSVISTTVKEMKKRKIL